MEVSGKKFVLAVVFIAMLAFAFGYTVNNYVPKSPRTLAGANVYVTIETATGVQDVPIHNVITAIGEQQVATRMRVSGSYNPVQFISIGNATASRSLTKLTQEHSRAQGTVSSLWSYGGYAAFNVTKKFTFTGTVTLNACGAHWEGTANSDNNMYAVANFQQTTFQQNWNLTITWIFVFQGQ